MKNLKKLTLALALAFVFALSCGAAMALELVVVADDEIVIEEGYQEWLASLAELGVTVKVVMGDEFEAVKTSPYLAVFFVHDPALNLDFISSVITSATQRMNLEVQGTRKFFSYENKLAEGQHLLVFSSARIGGIRAGAIFTENEVEWKAALGF